MNGPAPRQNELRELIWGLQSESLTPEDMARLESLLAGDLALRREFIEYMGLISDLQFGADPEMVERTLASVLEAPRAKSPDRLPSPSGRGRAPCTHGRGEGKSTSPVLGFLGNLSQIPGYTPALWTIAAMLFCTLTLACVIAIHGINVHVDQPQVARSNEQGAGSNSLPSPSGRGAGGEGIAAASPVARLIGSTDCKWADPSSAPSEGAKLGIGRKLELSSGRAKIAFDCGAEVALCGPAIFQIKSAKSGFMPLGYLSVRAATPAARGFTVTSLSAVATDLGTEFTMQASRDGHSRIQVTSGLVEVRSGSNGPPKRLAAGQSIEVEMGGAGITARIEPGDGTAAFKFPTIAPPSANDYADASQHHATIHAFGRRHPDSGPPSVLLDGRGQSKADSPKESFYFNENSSGRILLDLGQELSVRRINTYSWHVSAGNERDRARAVQKYDLYGARGPRPPPAGNNPAAKGWTLIARVNTDEVLGWPQAADRPAQQAVSIAADHGPIVAHRFLLWYVHPTRVDTESFYVEDNTFFSEFDVYAE